MLISGQIVLYAQAQLRAASEEAQLESEPHGEIPGTLLFRAIVTIRARFPQKITDIMCRKILIKQLGCQSVLAKLSMTAQQALRDVVALQQQNGIPKPDLRRRGCHYDSYRAVVLPRT